MSIKNMYVSINEKNTALPKIYHWTKLIGSISSLSKIALGMFYIHTVQFSNPGHMAFEPLKDG